MGVKPDKRAGHDDNFKQLGEADQPSFLEFVGALTGTGGEQEKRQNKQSGTEIDQGVAVHTRLFGGLKGNQDNERVFENIIIERAQKLGQKKR